MEQDREYTYYIGLHNPGERPVRIVLSAARFTRIISQVLGDCAIVMDKDQVSSVEDLIDVGLKYFGEVTPGRVEEVLQENLTPYQHQRLIQSLDRGILIKFELSSKVRSNQ